MIMPVFGSAHRAVRKVAQRFLIPLIKGRGDDGFWQSRKVSDQNTGCVMDCIAGPVKTFAVSWWIIKSVLNFFQPYGGAAGAENIFNFGSYVEGLIRMIFCNQSEISIYMMMLMEQKYRCVPFSFRNTPTLAINIGIYP